MADPVGIKVTGAKELRKVAKDVAGKEGTKALSKGHKQIAGIVAPEAKSNAPEPTGRLAANIRPLGSVTKAQVAVRGARVPYAGPIHGGWPERNIEPNPFITDAVRSEWPKVYDSLEDLYEELGRKLSTT